MPGLHFPWLSLNAALLCTLSLLYLLAGAAGRLTPPAGRPTSRAWTIARLSSSIALLFALVSGANIWMRTQALKEPLIIAAYRTEALALSFRLDAVTVLMLLLVTFLGWIITNYSRAYMSGDKRESRYIRDLMYTLSAVSMLVLTNNLLIFLASWVFTSLALHGLLTLYPYRQAAVISAHKKFLASLLGDLSLLCAVLLLGSQIRSFEIDEVVRHMARSYSVSASIQIAGLLLAASALIKSAQLPLHGWLIQVMEAPTPVSALLHAGVVNLGGFMLIRLGAIIGTTKMAQGLLVVIGCLTATIASLVMTTRISVKVYLAWSTCAQMGFMLMECGLGLYGLAFLHLLAHSLYKAHAFLGSGETVSQAKVKQMMPYSPGKSPAALLISPLLGILVATLSSFVWMPHAPLDPARMACIAIVGLAIAGPLAEASAVRSVVAALFLCLSALGTNLIYFGYDKLFDALVQTTQTKNAQPNHLLIFIVACFVLLYLLQSIMLIRPKSRLASALHPWFYAGLYMDELFTRATFRIWPAQPPTVASPRRDALQPFNM